MTNKYNNLLSWIKKNGGTINTISIKPSKTNERSVFSNTRIPKNRTVIKIPNKLIIHDGMGQKSFYGRELLRGNYTGIHNLKIALVCIFMLDDMSKNSFFLPYYKILPNTITNFPIFWDMRILSIIRGCSILDKIEMRKKQFYNDYNIICKCCPKFSQEYTFNDFLFVRVLVGSRNFGIKIDGINRTAMIPASDMLNHSPNPNVDWFYNTNKNCFIMKSNSNIPSHIEITDTYGNKCNNKLLLYYGFALPDNVYNTIDIHLSNNKIKTYNEKNHTTLPTSIECELMSSLQGENIVKLFSFLRILTAIENNPLDSIHNLDYNKPVSLHNELGMLSLLNSYMERLQKKYSLNYHDTCEFIKTINKNNPEYLALLLLRGELQIIRYFIDISLILMNSIKKKQMPTNKDCKEYYISVITHL